MGRGGGGGGESLGSERGAPADHSVINHNVKG